MFQIKPAVILVSQVVELKPNKTTTKLFHKYFGYRRACFNRALYVKEMFYEKYKLGQITELPTDYSLRDYIKHYMKFSWEQEYSQQVNDTAIQDLCICYKKFFTNPNYGKPTYRTRICSVESFRIQRRNDFTIRVKNCKLGLPRFPYLIKMKEDIRYSNYIIKECTIKRKANRYFAIFTIEVNRDGLPKDYDFNVQSVGIDLGMKNFMTLSYKSKNGKYITSYIDNKRSKEIYKRYENKIKKYQKILSRKKHLSNNYNRIRLKLQKIYLKIVNVQNDEYHKIANDIIREFGFISVDNIRINSLIRHFPSKRTRELIFRQALFKMKNILRLKSEIHHRYFDIIETVTTNLCSDCGFILKDEDKLDTHQRIFKCKKCGAIYDRDKNASINIDRMMRSKYKRIINGLGHNL